MSFKKLEELFSGAYLCVKFSSYEACNPKISSRYCRVGLV